jgi:hypothetical protein
MACEMCGGKGWVEGGSRDGYRLTQNCPRCKLGGDQVLVRAVRDSGIGERLWVCWSVEGLFGISLVDTFQHCDHPPGFTTKGRRCGWFLVVPEELT